VRAKQYDSFVQNATEECTGGKKTATTEWQFCSLMKLVAILKSTPLRILAPWWGWRLYTLETAEWLWFVPNDYELQYMLTVKTSFNQCARTDEDKKRFKICALKSKAGRRDRFFCKNIDLYKCAYRKSVREPHHKHPLRTRNHLTSIPFSLLQKWIITL